MGQGFFVRFLEKKKRKKSGVGQATQREKE